MKEEPPRLQNSSSEQQQIDSSSSTTDIKQRVSVGKRFKGSRELANLEKDEGVMFLLHALPSTRRKVPPPSSLPPSEPLTSNGGAPASLSHHRRPSNDVSVRPRTPLALSSQNINKNNLRKSFLPDEVCKVTPESLKNERTLSMLQKLPSSEYFKLWKSSTTYSLKGDDDEETPSSASKACGVRGLHKNYRDILVRTYPSFAQIILSPTSTGMKNTINANVCDEILDALNGFRKDPGCRAVILSGLGGVFSHGVDLSLLTYKSSERQRRNAEGLANAIRRLVVGLMACEELALVAAVNGEASGLAVSWLPLFDIVFASDKASFSTPYARLSMIPEACARLTFPPFRSSLSEMTLLGKSLTATEAMNLGLVTSVLWPEKFFEEIIPRLQMTSLLSPNGIQVLKSALKEPLRKKVLEGIDEDTRTLVHQWSSPAFAKAARQYLKTSTQV